MSLTLTESAKLTQDMLVRGVIETMVTESAVLKYLPFMTLIGNALTYNQEATLGTAGFYAVGGTWTESTPTFTQKTAALKILGGDSDVDQFLQRTYANPNDLEAVAIAAKAKSIANAFNDTFFNGDSSGDTNSFDGLDKLCVEGQTVSMGAAGGALTLDKMDGAIDKVKPGKPDVIFMSKRSRRKLSSLRRASGNILESDVDQFGRRVLYYDGIPIEVDENISDSQTVTTSTDCSTIYCARFGYETGIMGLDNGGIQVERVGALETKDAIRTRIKWYCAVALFRDIALSKLTGVRV
jgi:HK97 family phage major capsid protein